MKEIRCQGYVKRGGKHAVFSIWLKLQTELGEVNAQNILHAGRERIQQLGTTYKKVDYMLDFAEKQEEDA